MNAKHFLRETSNACPPAYDRQADAMVRTTSAINYTGGLRTVLHNE